MKKAVSIEFCRIMYKIELIKVIEGLSYEKEISNFRSISIR